MTRQVSLRAGRRVELAELIQELSGSLRSWDMTTQRMDNVGVVVDDLVAATAFFVEIGLELEGAAKSRDNGWTASSASTEYETTSPCCGLQMDTAGLS